MGKIIIIIKEKQRKVNRKQEHVGKIMTNCRFLSLLNGGLGVQRPGSYRTSKVGIDISSKVGAD